MKKIAASILLFIFLFNTMGYFIVFSTLRYQLKSNMKQQLENNSFNSPVSVIAVNKSESKFIDWLEEGKEMNYNGSRYDVVKSENNGDETIYYCINDTQEESLFTSLYNHVLTHVSSSAKNNASKKSVDDLTQLYFSDNTAVSFINITQGKQQLPTNVFSILSAQSFIDCPPPEVF